jgi:hypothetical protein
MVPPKAVALITKEIGVLKVIKFRYTSKDDDYFP